MSTCKSLESFKGRGAVRMALRASDGTLSNWFKVAQARRLEITINQDFEDQYDRCGVASANIIHSLNQTDYEVAIETFDFSSEMLAKAFYGTNTDVAGTSITDENFGSVAIGDIISVEHPFSLTSVTVEDGATPLVLNTDYTLDADHGIITMLSSATDLNVSYTYADYEKIEGALQSVREYAIAFDGYNINNADKGVQVIMHRVALNSSTSLMLITEETFNLELTGKLLADATQGSGESQYFVIKKEV